MSQKTIEELVRKKSVFKTAIESALNHVIITDVKGKVVFANDSVERITGFSRQEVVGNTPSLWGRQMPKEFYDKLWHTIKEKKKPFAGEVTNKRKNGQKYIARAIISPILDEENELIGFIGTEEDITKEKEIDLMKTEFISLASHQLRTPLTVIKWNLEMLEGSYDRLENFEKRAFTSAQEASEKMLELVKLFLNISRLESGRLMVTPKPTNIERMVDQVTKEVAPLAKEKEVEIVINTDGDAMEKINLDPTLVKEVLKNVIDNAIKYTKEKTVVAISTKQDEKYVTISVADSGIGIPKEEQGEVLKKFYRATNAQKSHKEGTGLGLYLAQLIMNASGGKIAFDSEKDKGATFYMSFPKAGSQKKEGEVQLS
ncbi:MAG: PAS domain-containing sensor histidine kinase [Candidatus Moranbacteria bacterium]|nr:PAS domain-containing sensor histidine kinase [Candidatus Moranbacteria bacterium]